MSEKKHQISDLRQHLFETIERLKDRDNPMDLARARTIADVGRVLIDSAKAETERLVATGASSGTDFIGESEVDLKAVQQSSRAVASLEGRRS